MSLIECLMIWSTEAYMRQKSSVGLVSLRLNIVVAHRWLLSLDHCVQVKVKFGVVYQHSVNTL